MLFKKHAMVFKDPNNSGYCVKIFHLQIYDTQLIVKNKIQQEIAPCYNNDCRRTVSSNFYLLIFQEPLNQLYPFRCAYWIYQDFFLIS